MCEICGAEATNAYRVMITGGPVRDADGRIWPTFEPGPWRYGCNLHASSEIAEVIPFDPDAKYITARGG